MKLLLAIISVLCSFSILAQNYKQRPVLCETNVMNSQQSERVESNSALDSLLRLNVNQLRFIYLSNRLSPQNIDNFVKNKKYLKNILPTHHAVWISRLDLEKSQNYTILLSALNCTNSKYVHQLYQIQNLQEKLPESLPFERFIVWKKNKEMPNNELLTSLNSFWSVNLRPVHIIIDDSLDQNEQLKTQLEKQNRVFGTFLYQHKTVGDVQINATKNKSGYFSMPFQKTIRIHPKKLGFYFEPSCVASNVEMKEFEREVIVLPLKLEDNMIADAGITNNNQVQLYDVDIVKFKDKSNVFSFQKKTSQISLKNSSLNANGAEFSISFWIYPTSKAELQNIISQDTVINIKIFNGKYCVTSVGKKDYRLENVPVEFHKWSFISFVFEQNTLTVYRNGIQIQRINIAPILIGNRNFQIGNNIWDEHFKGYLKSISVWERALSNNEVLQLYNLPETTDASTWITLFLLFFLVLGCVVFIVEKRKKKKYFEVSPLVLSNVRTSENTFQRRIQFIGNLHLWNANKEDISLKMSGKQKQLFCLLALQTFQQEAGISSTEINDTFWPGMDTKSANNNRNVYILRLKKILLEFPEIEIQFENKHWKINLQPNVSCDYVEILTLEKELKAKENQHLSHYLALIHNTLLTDMQDTWLDRLKSDFEEERLSFLETLLKDKLDSNDFDQSLLIANAMLALDDFNELAFNAKIEALQKLKKKSLAIKYQQKYLQRYEEIYGK